MSVDFEATFSSGSEFDITFSEDSELDVSMSPGEGGGAVSSVNGKTGAVVLDAGDLEYDDEETYSAGSVGAELSSLKGGLNGKLDEPSTAGTSGQVLTSDGEGGQYWHTPSGGGGGGSVDSVNGKTGVVVLDASDVGAASSEDLDSIGTWSPGKNKYNKDACSPSDKHGYSSSGDYFESDYYATTGKIPVEASTQYAISAGSAAVKTVRYYSGSEGSTFISGADVWDNTFTTPSGCTYIAINLFGAIHTTSDYQNAIASTQLEIGSAPTTFEPYKEILTINLDNVEDGDTLSGIADAFYLTPGKNKYNKDACNPADKYVYSSSGDYSASDYYATTGKIPVEASTTYVFSAGNVAVKTVRYFSGVSGATFISGEEVSGAFTTPQNCTFIAINLFGATHTTTQYNDAIASAQLEKGVTVTAYEQYAEHAEIYSDRVENGEVLTEMNNILVKQSQVNLYDKTLAENNKYVSGDTVGTSNTYAYTGAIPVKPSTQYNLSKSEDAPMTISTTINEYNAVGAFLRTKSPTRTQHSNIPFVTDADTYYVKVNLVKENHTEQDFTDTIDSLMLCYGSNRPSEYIAYNETAVVPNDSLGNTFFDKPNLFTGKKWIAIGTSITWYDGMNYESGVHTGDICRGYVGDIAARKKLEVENQGINGASLGNVNSSSLINRYTSIDWSSADIATIEFGVNDYGANVAVGVASDAAGTSTFAACLKTVIEYALAQNPTLCLVICTDPDVRGTSLNNNGNTLKDYADVTIAIAEQYRLPICDWFYRSGINSLNKGDTTKDWMTIDGTHPTDKGQNRMAAMLNQIFDSLFC